jgi:hypothetical protein
LRFQAVRRGILIPACEVMLRMIWLEHSVERQVRF